MKNQTLILLLSAAFAVIFMFLPSLIFNFGCLLGYCEFVSGEYVPLFQFIQVSWLAACLLIEIFSNHIFPFRSATKF